MHTQAIIRLPLNYVRLLHVSRADSLKIVHIGSGIFFNYDGEFDVIFRYHAFDVRLQAALRLNFNVYSVHNYVLRRLSANHNNVL